MPWVAVLHVLAEDDFQGRSWVTALKHGLRELGWNDGLNIKIDVRAGGGEVNQIEQSGHVYANVECDLW
ncbi:hypothetical protein ACQ7B2_15690, partial [Escherichia coli]